ncbi:hypothetical protein [Clostridium sporogenes]|uniref:hypothetical protein n=1 Tax=Clostridium sporogenes TaxID=1509 RepID=UPI00024BA878|nr:hypothetical protein [Clostridium sporogenes]EHN15110.1 hypothetical protein IYC_09509 [Clostridium sporogenes PA 3679]MCW6105193.1 hypothetical protein [Clostridium sporogenes]MDU4596391.1 hypothetical protein [Clostridium sporogenes]NFQ33225.1 hypothetical protein [Clostridium sporogenes]NFQ58811.1 hypothetical protein [Clostridium sporogenes]
MSCNVNNVCIRKPYDSFIMSKHQSKKKDTEESQKKKQVVSERQGNYYCTYMVDEEGKKVLINKIPVEEAEEQNGLLSSNKSDNKKSLIYNSAKNTNTDFGYKQQMNMEATYRKNQQEIMKNLGSPSNSNKYYGY